MNTFAEPTLRNVYERGYGKLPICALSGCGQPVQFTNTELCEDHYADQAELWHGRDQSINTFIAKR